MQQPIVHQQLQPLLMPQRLSMLNSQPAQIDNPAMSIPVGPLRTPVSITSTKSTSTPRKALTDLDRKRMCQYAEENPNAKQTEIGAIFGVERSTASRVLRQKEKYLLQDDGGRSLLKRAKGLLPDTERALTVWAKDQEKRGHWLSHKLIRNQAQTFAATTTAPGNRVALSASWIKQFKLKNNLLGARPRKASLAPKDINSLSVAPSSLYTPGSAFPVSSPGLGSSSPIENYGQKSLESLKTEGLDRYLDYSSRHAPGYSQSITSPHSAFTDTAPSSSSPGLLSLKSPFFTSDSGTAPSHFVPQLSVRPELLAAASASSQELRSMTFQRLDYTSLSGEVATSKYANYPIPDLPVEEAQDPLMSPDKAVERLSIVNPFEVTGQPPLPLHIMQHNMMRNEMGASILTQATTSPEEARRALEVVLSFFEQQHYGTLHIARLRADEQD